MHPLITLAAIAASPSSTATCHEITAHADGTVSERVVVDDGSTTASATSNSSGAANSHSSVTASSSSSSSSEGSSSSSFSGDHGSSVKVERANGECRITITER